MHKRVQFWRLAVPLVVLLLTLSACQASQSTAQPEATAGVAASPSAAATGPLCSTPPVAQHASLLPCLNGKATVEMKVNGGTITVDLDGAQAPITAGNFVDLVNKGFYNGLTFHRVVKEPTPFVVQGGDPNGNGTGSYTDPTTSQTRYIPLEIRPAESNAENQPLPVYSQVLDPASGSGPALRHIRGAIAMARSQQPNSASSQFYFTLDDQGFLDGSYAVFGFVTQGMEVVDRIKQGDKIESAQVVSGLENLQLPGGGAATPGATSPTASPSTP
ncbi:peptidylprolyl isomerase [Leptolyngbya sp. FACHB-261]|uniref:peptidylprolyl isomerase n=1 Tax=Leptolyngbya sp. FACHB-261 TaxID=2692806 RepID=UPI001685F91B|nr:peptidylprolyl isomerase [Leptolyngbya sp. FACHB-261]MBD2101990.1 peptidylprolyl isomerase [Leptolyngbya sp. FACHB-261]